MTIRRLAATVLILASCAAIASAQDRADLLIGLARVKRDSGEATAARSYFEQARAVRSLTSGELTEYFWVLAAIDATSALNVAQEILGREAKDDVRERAIALAVGLDDEVTVVRLAGEGRRRNPRTALWPRRLGESYLRSNQPATAVTAYRDAVAAPDATAGDRAALALALEASGAHADSLAAWESLSERERSVNVEWVRARRRVLATTARAEIVAAELDPWLASHPDDHEVREMLVEAWARSGEPARALEALTPLLSGPRGEYWAHREIELARAAGDSSLAIARLEGLLQHGRATRAEMWTLADLLVTARRFDKATRIVSLLSARVTGCDERLLTLIDRFPGDVGTKLMVSEVSARKCLDKPTWIVRSAQRSVAEERHGEALAAVRTLPDGERRRLRTLEGQLLLWTGDARDAIPVLQAALADSPSDRVARLALVDAYRFAGRPYEAWETASPLLTQPDLAVERRVDLADLALRADRPGAVESVLTEPSSGQIPETMTDTLRGRALVAAGRPVEAAQLLGSIAPRDLGPDGTLALLDSVIATRGWTAALEVAASFTERTPEWRDVMLRRTVILFMNGRAEEARALRAALSAIDPVLAPLADAEWSLAAERPLDALRALEGVTSAADQDRIDDLIAKALADAGNLAASAAIVQRLAASRPEFVARSARAAELAWRLDPTEASLERLIAIQARVPGHMDVAVLVAEAFSETGRHDAAVALLETKTNHLPVRGRIVLARALRASGRTSDALRVIETLDLPTESQAILRGELIAAVHGEARADTYFRSLASGADATPALYRAWTTLVSAPAERARILADSAARFPDDRDTLTLLAESRSEMGDHPGAVDAARRAVRQDESNVKAWLVLIDSTAAMTRGPALDDLLAEFAPRIEANPTLAIAAAEHVAGLARGPNDPLIPLTLTWLDGTTQTTGLTLPRALARARVLALAERWNEAVAATDDAIAVDPRALEALRLRAEVLSWSGAHARALEAYDAYLALSPLDREARRHQARVAGWAGWREEAARRYTVLAADFPADPLIAIEAKAKLAFLDGRWREAAAAYEEWLRLEPSNSEAQFELAEALRADGETDRADQTLEGLALSTGHQLAGTARERALHNERPAVSVIARQRSSDGSGDERLLDLAESGAGLTFTAGANTRTTIALEGVYFDAASGEARRTGSHSNMAIAERLTRKTTLEGRVDWWRIGMSTNVVTGGTRFAWRQSDRWLATAGIQRDLILENVATMDLGLVGYGPAATVRFDSPRAAFSTNVQWQRISDGNTRARATVSYGQVVSQRIPQLRLLAWGEVLSYREESQFYFAPAGFLRADGGASYTHQFSRPRFQGDRRNELSVSYLLGGDDRRAVYHHPAVRLSIEVVEGMAVDAQADWIRSPAYDETAFVVGLRIGGSAGRR